MKSEGDAHARKSSVPVAHVHITETGEFHKRSELATPQRHLGSLAFSSLSTEESSICDADALSRHMGTLSLQGSLQDESYGTTDRNTEEFATTAEFLMHTWHTNHKDRQFLLQNEKLLEDLVNGREEHYVGGLNSYYRMLLHRLADVWGVEHNLVSVNGQAKISLKITEDSKKPDQLFRDMADRVPDEPGKALLKRPKNNSLPESNSLPAPAHVMRPARSLEERQAHYDQVRERIFNTADHGTDNMPKPYGLDPHHGERSDGNHVGYHRSRSAISETGSEAAFDEQHQNRLAYGQFAGRPIMVQPMGMYPSPYIYPGPMMSYGNPEMAVDASAYAGGYVGAQPPYYPMYGPQYVPAQSLVYPGVAYGQQQTFPQQYFPAQNTMDPSQTPSMYDQPAGQYLYAPYPAPPLEMPVTGPGPHTAYLPHPAATESQPYMYDPNPRQAPPTPTQDPRFGPPLIRQPLLDHPEAARAVGGHPHEGWIIPLQLPGQPGGGMFLKIPAPRPPPPAANQAAATGDGVARQSSSSGRSSAENVGYYKQEYRSPSPKEGNQAEGN
ncbi:R3H domain-containing protein 2-like isoform X2 [Paramacrobiotus metropolitanus]|nr:R3H domain-containing protein 2-like isoform X2 [Paramacrobiotus metropolitanus]